MVAHTLGGWTFHRLSSSTTSRRGCGRAIMLDARILSGEVSNDAAVLLGSGAAIFVTNIIVFGIWYWELDRGGPFARHAGERPYPDFMFPQMTTPHVAKPDWRPTFVDYLYLTSSPA
jgi:hypothetical protein